MLLHRVSPCAQAEAIPEEVQPQVEGMEGEEEAEDVEEEETAEETAAAEVEEAVAVAEAAKTQKKPAALDRKTKEVVFPEGVPEVG